MLWKPAFFGVKPSLVVKGGMIADGGDGRPERVDPDAAAGALPADVRRLRRRRSRSRRVTFVSQAAIDAGVPAELGLASGRSRGARHAHDRQGATWCRNGATPKIEVDAQTYEVRADGVLLTCEPATVLPMAQRYFLF